MNVLFLSLAPIASLEDRGIYPDLLRIFVKNGHFVRIISVQPDRATYDDRREGYAVLHVQTPQMQKVGLLKKGIASLQIGPNIRRALDRHCRNERYDLILMGHAAYHSGGRGGLYQKAGRSEVLPASQGHLASRDRRPGRYFPERSGVSVFPCQGEKALRSG